MTCFVVIFNLNLQLCYIWFLGRDLFYFINVSPLHCIFWLCFSIALYVSGNVFPLHCMFLVLPFYQELLLLPLILKRLPVFQGRTCVILVCAPPAT